MITQEFKNDTSTIKIENATSLEDAKKNKFAEGIFSRISIDGKPVEYMDMIQHIISNATKTGTKFIPPSDESLRQMQKDLIQKQKEDFRAIMVQMKQKYGEAGVPVSELDKFDDIADKVDLAFVRVEK
jgi:hypothetical protein